MEKKTQSAKVRTCLWFNGQGEEAARFYVSLLPGSEVETVSKPNPNGPALVVEFRLAGTPYMVLNGGPNFTHSPAASISVLTKDQAETDALWHALLKDGGQESMCGWLVDRFGVSWQIIPEAVPAFMMSNDKAGAQRAQAAMMQMKKIDIAKMEAAFAQGRA
jgi:predicted 3-demethylubiquinone-9 3-methyltransferase (glyoxalase superfamily)